MARCSYCGSETQLYDLGNPICVPCSEKQYQKIRDRELERLRKHTDPDTKLAQKDAKSVAC
jgi:hypothetical protein